MSNLLGIANLMKTFYSSEEYQEILFDKKVKQLDTGSTLCDLAKNMIHKIEEKLVFSALKPYPVIDTFLAKGEEVLVLSEDHPLHDHKVTYFGKDKEGYHLIGRNSFDIQKIWPSHYPQSDNLVRERNIHEITVDSYLSFANFIKTLPEELVMANPFVPINTEPSIGDLVYVKNKDMKEALCRIEEFDGEFYDLFTLHRSIDKHFEMTQEGFHILAQKENYDQEFFEKPFLNLEEIRNIVVPVVTEYLGSSEVKESLAGIQVTYSGVVNHYLEKGESIPRTLQLLQEKNADTSIVIGAMKGDPFSFLQTFEDDLEPYLNLFNNYKKFSSNLIAEVAQHLNINEEELFNVPHNDYFNGLRLRLKENPRKNGDISWGNTNPVGDTVVIDFGPKFNPNGSRSGDQGEYSKSETVVLDKEGYLQIRYPEDLCRLVRLMDYQMDKHGGNESQLVDIVENLKENDHRLSMEDLFSFSEYDHEQGLSHSGFNHRLIKDPELIKSDLTGELKHLGFSFDETRQIFSYFFPNNIYVQSLINSGLLDIGIVYDTIDIAKQSKKARIVVEKATRGVADIGSQLNLSYEPDVNIEDAHELGTLSCMLTLNKKADALKKTLNHIYGEGVHTHRRLTNYITDNLLTEGEETKKWPGHMWIEEKRYNMLKLVYNSRPFSEDDFGLEVLKYVGAKNNSKLEKLTNTKQVVSVGTDYYSYDLLDGGIVKKNEEFYFHIVELYKEDLSSKTEIIARAPDISRFGELGAMMSMMGLGGGFDSLVMDEVEEAIKKPVSLFNEYEGKTGFEIHFPTNLVDDCKPFINDFISYFNNNQTVQRNQIMSGMNQELKLLK